MASSSVVVMEEPASSSFSSSVMTMTSLPSPSSPVACLVSGMLAECSCSPACSFHSLSSLAEKESVYGSEGKESVLPMAIDEALPLELLHYILSFLPLADLARSAARTSRLWRSLALDPSIWMPHWRRLHQVRPRVELSEADVKRGVQLPPENVFDDIDGDPYLIDCGCSLKEALRKDIPIDWRREYLRKKNFSVLVVTFHTSHGNHYDLDVVRQLKKFGIEADICHLMCNHSINKHSHEYRFVDYDDNLFLKYDSIIYFAAMSGGDSLKKMLGDSLMEYLQAGGGVVFCTYTHMKSYQLMGKWTESFYPMKPIVRQPLQSPKRNVPIDSEHPIISGTKKQFHIDPTRLNSRFDGEIDPLARVAGEYKDGLPLAIVLDEYANEQKGREELAEALSTELEGDDPVSDDEQSDALRSMDFWDQPKEEKPKRPLKWGRTVFLNFFPVSKDDPGTGGWYDWNSDLPLVLRNAALYAARKGATPSSSDDSIKAEA